MIEWRSIIGYEGLYEVNNIGEVRSLDRTQYEQKFINGSYKEVLVHHAGKVLAQTMHRKGYMEVKLSKGGEQTTHKVHRLVAEAFIPNPNNYLQINHKDECKQNNCVENLEWCDQDYNIGYGTGNFRRSIAISRKVEQLSLAGEHVAYFHGSREASRQTGVTNVRHACNGARKTAGGYIWRYVS